MDDRDEWLEGVRRWYFGGEAPADVSPDELAWPSPAKAADAEPGAKPWPSVAAQMRGADHRRGLLNA